MLDWVIYGMVYLGSALMVYNIYGFISYGHYVSGHKGWGEDALAILKLPTVLLVMFLAGYLAVGIFGAPDLIVSGILFGGSIFVFVMCRMLRQITVHIVEGEQLEAELMAAEESNRAKTSFLSSMSHEMRTPMNVILGIDHLALSNPSLVDETREQLEKIDLSARHLLGLINNILDMNSIESGEMALMHEEFPLHDALDQIDALIGTLCEEKGLEYRPMRDKDIADRCVGDEMELKQALLSVLDNAIKFTDAPGMVSFATLLSSTEPGRQTLRFVISDTGVGMSKDFIPHIFDAFAREDSSSTNRFGGGGLSLSVTKSVIERMGGSIQVESAKDIGTTVTLTVPLELVEENEDEAWRDELASYAGLEGKRVLIVEDIDANAEIVQDLLELEDVETERAVNGQVAVDMFAASEPYHYDAVLMDLRMPVMDGIEATRRIRRFDRPDARSIPIIALTANAFESDKQQTHDAGMNAHLAKPTDADLLYATLRSEMGQAEARHEGTQG